MAEHEFKKGDRVVFVKNDTYFGVDMPKGTHATYDGDAGPRASWVVLDSGQGVAAWRRCIAPAEPETPAPLDPSKVKPGDTVTLEMEGGRKVTAPVSERTLPGKAPGTWFLDVYRDRGPVSFSAVNWTLTDHQPAPEPETPADVDMWAAKDALQAEVAAEVFQTPAPLDPSAVKPGDTVTLERGTALVRDVVIEVKKRGEGQFLFYTGENPDPLILDTYYLVNPGAWTLTAHQPAPEPEPEWKPGDTVTEEVHILDATELQPGDVFVGPDLFDGYIVRRAQPGAERVQGEVTAAVRRGAEDLRSLYLTDQTEPVSRYHEEATTVLAAALDVDEMAQELHAADQGVNGLALPWAHESAARRESWRYIATALRAAILGGAA